MWRAKLQTEEYRTLYFNAWESDFTENALISLLGEFRESVVAFTGKENKVSKAIGHLGAAIAKYSLPVAIKLVSAGAINSKELSDAIGEVSSKIAEERIKKYQEEKNTISAFKSELEKFVRETSPGKPILFFIDELDRCRPHFAIEVLEHAKHLFNVRGVVFILSVDKTQLGHSLRSVYGINMDVDGYLSRFIDLTYALPPPDMIGFTRSIVQRFADFDGVLTQRGRPAEAEAIQYALSSLCRIFPISLRTLEQILTSFVVAWKLLPDQGSCLLVITLVALRRIDPERFHRLIRHENAFAAEAEQLRTLLKGHRLPGQLVNASYFVLTLLTLFWLTNDKADDLQKKLIHDVRVERQTHDEEKNQLWRYFGYCHLSDEVRGSVLNAVELAEGFSTHNS